MHYWAGSDSLAHRAGDRVRVLSRCDFPALTSEGMRSGGVADLVELQLQKATWTTEDGPCTGMWRWGEDVGG